MCTAMHDATAARRTKSSGGLHNRQFQPPNIQICNPLGAGLYNWWAVKASEARNPPSNTYLKALISAINSGGRVPIDIRNECHRLMQAIDANDAAWINASVERIERLAAEAELALPRR